VRNVGLKGKHKLADKWGRDVYIVVEQPNPDVPVFLVKKEHGRGNPRTVHRNLLLPFSGLPLKNTVESDASFSCTKPVHTVDTTSISKTPAPNSPSSVDKYVIPQKRKSTLNPCALPFVPDRVARKRKPPSWLTSTYWVT
jgi:hypothetical protein